MTRETEGRGDPSTVAGQFPQDLGGGGGGGGASGRSYPLKVATQQHGGINSRGGLVYINDSKLGGTRQGYYFTENNGNQSMPLATSAPYTSTSGASGVSSNFTFNTSNPSGYFGAMKLYVRATPQTASLSAIFLSVNQSGLAGNYFNSYQTTILSGAKYGTAFGPANPAATASTIGIDVPLQILPGLFVELQPDSKAFPIGRVGYEKAYSPINRQRFGTFNIFPHNSLSFNLQATALALGGGTFLTSVDFFMSAEIRDIQFDQMPSVA